MLLHRRARPHPTHADHVAPSIIGQASCSQLEDCGRNDTRYALYFRRIRAELWDELEQAGRDGRLLPTEIGGIRCSLHTSRCTSSLRVLCQPAIRADSTARFARVHRCRDGCYVRACALNGTEHVRYCVDSALPLETAVPTLPMPKLELAARLELTLTPPLVPPVHSSAHAWSKAISSELGFNQQQFVAAELSTTGSILLLDVVPQDMFYSSETFGFSHHVSGRQVPAIVKALVDRVHSVRGLSALGHCVDAHVGVWRQLASREPPHLLTPSSAVLTKRSTEPGEESHFDPVPYVLCIVGLVLLALGYLKFRRLFRKEGELQRTVARLRERAAYTGIRNWEDLDVISKISYGLNL